MSDSDLASNLSFRPDYLNNKTSDGVRSTSTNTTTAATSSYSFSNNAGNVIAANPVSAFAIPTLTTTATNTRTAGHRFSPKIQTSRTSSTTSRKRQQDDDGSTGRNKSDRRRPHDSTKRGDASPTTKSALKHTKRFIPRLRKGKLTSDDIEENIRIKKELEAIQKEQENADPNRPDKMVHARQLFYYERPNHDRSQVSRGKPGHDHVDRAGDENKHESESVFAWRLRFVPEKNEKGQIRAVYDRVPVDSVEAQSVFVKFSKERSPEEVTPNDSQSSTTAKTPRLLNPVASYEFFAPQLSCPKRFNTDASYVKEMNRNLKQRATQLRTIYRTAIQTFIQQIRSPPSYPRLAPTSSLGMLGTSSTHSSDSFRSQNSQIEAGKLEFSQKQLEVVNTLLGHETDDIRMRIEIIVTPRMLQTFRELLIQHRSNSLNDGTSMNDYKVQGLQRLIGYFEKQPSQRDRGRHPLCAIGRFQSLFSSESSTTRTGSLLSRQNRQKSSSSTNPSDNPKLVFPNDVDSLVTFSFLQVDALWKKLQKLGYYDRVKFRLSLTPVNVSYSLLGRPFFFTVIASPGYQLPRDSMVYRSYTIPFMMEAIRRQFAEYDADYPRKPMISCITIDLFVHTNRDEPNTKPSAGNALSCAKLYDEITGRLVHTRAELWLEHLEESLKKTYLKHETLGRQNGLDQQLRIAFRVGFWTKLTSNLSMELGSIDKIEATTPASSSQVSPSSSSDHQPRFIQDDGSRLDDAKLGIESSPFGRTSIPRPQVPDSSTTAAVEIIDISKATSSSAAPGQQIIMSLNSMLSELTSSNLAITARQIRDGNWLGRSILPEFAHSVCQYALDTKQYLLYGSLCEQLVSRKSEFDNSVDSSADSLSLQAFLLKECLERFETACRTHMTSQSVEGQADRSEMKDTKPLESSSLDDGSSPSVNQDEPSQDKESSITAAYSADLPIIHLIGEFFNRGLVDPNAFSYFIEVLLNQRDTQSAFFFEAIYLLLGISGADFASTKLGKANIARYLSNLVFMGEWSSSTEKRSREALLRFCLGRIESIYEATSQDRILKDVMVDEEQESQDSLLSDMEFIGELFEQQLVTAEFVLDLFNRLLGMMEGRLYSRRKVRGLCVLLKKVGDKLFQHPLAKDTETWRCFERLKTYQIDNEISASLKGPLWDLKKLRLEAQNASKAYEQDYTKFSANLQELCNIRLCNGKSKGSVPEAIGNLTSLRKKTDSEFINIMIREDNHDHPVAELVKGLKLLLDNSQAFYFLLKSVRGLARTSAPDSIILNPKKFGEWLKDTLKSSNSNSTESKVSRKISDFAAAFRSINSSIDAPIAICSELLKGLEDCSQSLSEQLQRQQEQQKQQEQQQQQNSSEVSTAQASQNSAPTLEQLSSKLSQLILTQTNLIEVLMNAKKSWDKFKQLFSESRRFISKRGENMAELPQTPQKSKRANSKEAKTDEDVYTTILYIKKCLEGLQKTIDLASGLNKQSTECLSVFLSDVKLVFINNQPLGRIIPSEKLKLPKNPIGSLGESCKTVFTFFSRIDWAHSLPRIGYDSLQHIVLFFDLRKPLKKSLNDFSLKCDVINKHIDELSRLTGSKSCACLSIEELVEIRRKAVDVKSFIGIIIGSDNAVNAWFSRLDSLLGGKDDSLLGPLINKLGTSSLPSSKNRPEVGKSNIRNNDANASRRGASSRVDSSKSNSSTTQLPLTQAQTSVRWRRGATEKSSSTSSQGG